LAAGVRRILPRRVTERAEGPPPMRSSPDTPSKVDAMTAAEQSSIPSAKRNICSEASRQTSSIMDEYYRGGSLVTGSRYNGGILTCDGIANIESLSSIR
jgi:hypothetical protein